MFPAVAVACSLGASEDLILRVPALWGVAVSPLRLTLIGAAAAYALQVRWGGRMCFATPAMACLLAAGMGHTAASIAHTFTSFLQWASVKSWRVIPRSSQAWGVLSIIAAFVLLAGGAAVSLRKGRVAEREDRAAHGEQRH